MWTVLFDEFDGVGVGVGAGFYYVGTRCEVADGECGADAGGHGTSVHVGYGDGGVVTDCYTIVCHGNLQIVAYLRFFDARRVEQ